MAEINLLPEELRKKEIKEKERIAKHPKSFDILLNQPDATKTKEIKPVNKESWWRKILGYPVASKTQLLNNPPKEDKIINGPNFKSIESREVIKEVLPPKDKVKQKKGWFSFLGSPKPLIVSMPKIKEIKKLETQKSEPIIYQKAISISKIKEKDDLRTVKDKENKTHQLVPSPVSIKQYNDSWWEVLKSLFVPVKHQNEKVHLVSDEIIKKPQIIAKPQLFSSKINQEKKSSFNYSEKKVTEDTKKKDSLKKEYKKKKNQSTTYNLVEFNKPKNILDVNFIPIDLLSNRATSKSRELLHIFIAILIPTIILLLSYSIIFWGQTQLNVSMKQRNALLDFKIKQIGDYEARLKKNNDLANRIINIANLRKNKLAWSNFFELLEKYTLDGVYYNNLTIDTSGSFLLPGIADSYEVLAKQLALLNSANDFVKGVKISNIQSFSDSKTGVSGVSFQLRLILADHVFSLKEN